MSKIQLIKHIENDELDLSLQNLSDIPIKEIANFTKLRSIDLSCNVIENLPINLGLLTKITKLDLSKNKLKSLPEEIGQMVNLEHLDLRENKLVTLPISMCNLKKLKWLDLKGNPLSQDIKSAAGDCLNSSQCAKCAGNVLAHLEVLKCRKSKSDEKKKMKENELLKQKEKNEKEVRDKKKAEKAQERLLKRKLDEEKLEQMNQNSNENEVNGNNIYMTETSMKCKKNESGIMRGFWSHLIISVILGLIAVFVMMSLLFFCNHSVSNHNENMRNLCLSINGKLPKSMVSLRDQVWRYVEKYALNI